MFELSKEDKRQFVHIALGCLLVYLLEIGFISEVGSFLFTDSFFIKPEALVLLIVSVFGVSLSFLCRNVRVPVINWFLKHLERDCVRKNEPGRGAIYGAFGSFLVLLFFNLEIVKASILVLTFGDSISNIVGVRFGQTSNPLNEDKTVEGTFFGGLGGFLGASFYFSFFPSFFAVTAAMIAESVEFFLDDNLITPIVSGIVLYLLT